MKKIIVIFLIINVLSCKDKQNTSNNKNTSKSSETQIIVKKNNSKKKRIIESFDYSKPYYINDTSKIDDISYLKKLCVENFLNTNYDITNIKSLKKIWSGELFSMGKSQVYKLNLIDVSESMSINTLIVVNSDKKVMYRINIQQFEPTFLKSDLPPVFSGRYYYRGGGDFYSYRVVNDTLFNFFESDLVTLLYSDRECKCYKNNNLKLINKDLNNDGLFDLQFIGYEYNYCKGYASRTIKNKIPIDSTYINFTYILNFDDKLLKYIKQ